jgi:hypothetical protein
MFMLGPRSNKRVNVKAIIYVQSDTIPAEFSEKVKNLAVKNPCENVPGHGLIGA